MNERMKQRTVGMAVILALIAIVLPYLFDESAEQHLRNVSYFKPPPPPQRRASLNKQHDEKKIKTLLANKKNNQIKTPSWTIRLASFANAANADQLQKQLRVKGFNAYIHTAKDKSGKKIILVLVGPELDQKRALHTLKRLQKQTKMKGMLVAFNTLHQ